MRILVLGAGAVGLTVAAQLSRHAEVFAVCRERCVSAISEHNFTMTGIWGERTLPLSVGTKPPEGPWDYIIISTKSAATRGICEEYRDIFAYTFPYLSKEFLKK